MGYYERNTRKKNKIEDFCQRIVIERKNIFEKKTITKQFNDYFIDIGPNLASNVQTNEDI